MNCIKSLAVVALCVSAALLAACGLGGPYPGVPILLSPSAYEKYTGPVAPPQVGYRIDENRYFEIVPYRDSACELAQVYYTDKVLGIHTAVVKWDYGVMGTKPFVVDAANDQYLVGPVSRGNTDCSSGGGGCGGASMPYSTDAGRTWERVGVFSPTAPISASASKAYALRVTDSVMSIELMDATIDSQSWKYLPEAKLAPAPRKAPIDTKFHCTPNGKE